MPRGALEGARVRGAGGNFSVPLAAYDMTYEHYRALRAARARIVHGRYTGAMPPTQSTTEARIWAKQDVSLKVSRDLLLIHYQDRLTVPKTGYFSPEEGPLHMGRIETALCLMFLMNTMPLSLDLPLAFI